MSSWELSYGQIRHIMSMMKIKHRSIPEYLRRGEFYGSLSEDDPEEVLEIPSDCFVEDDEGQPENLEQFKQLLRVMIFWMLDKVPLGVSVFCVLNDIELWRDAVLNLPGGNKSALVEGLLLAFAVKEQISLYNALKIVNWEAIAGAVAVMNPEEEDNSAIGQAAQAGNLKAVKLLHESGFKWTESTCIIASQCGHMDCLRYAYEHGCPWNQAVYQQAMVYGHLHCIQYAHQQGLEWHADVCAHAACYGQLECLQYVRQHGCPWDEQVYTQAIIHGHQHIVQYAHQQGLQWYPHHCAQAAYEGQQQCLLYMLEHNCPMDITACMGASEKGHLACLQLLHTFDAPWDTDTCVAAARCSDPACLRFLHEHGCPWNQHTPSLAAHMGNVDNLRYALDHHCDYNSNNLLIDAAQGCQLHCLQYLIEVQGLYMRENGHLFISALLKGNLQCLQYLIDQGCPYHTAQYYSSESGKAAYDRVFTPNNPEFVQCLQYAVERGWCIDQNCIDYLVSRDWDNCGEYLTQEGYIVGV